MKKNKWFGKIGALALAIVFGLTAIPAGAVFAQPDDGVEEREVITLSTPEDLMNLAEQTKYDKYSVGKVIKLSCNIDMSGYSFEGLGYFNGTFEGQGYTISGVSINEKASDRGFFRYVGPNGVINNLKVNGAVEPSGTRNDIGGIAGVNYGLIFHCSFEGTVAGDEYVGGIAGVNKSDARILCCQASGIVTGTDFTGGIAGSNEGLIAACSSDAEVNTDELETTLDVGGVDLGDLNVTKNVVTRNYMGGIAGISTGIINDCTNNGTIGFKHTGYNVGGIVGGQSGVVIDCTNNGNVYGRKDVGGIVGQAEPYVQSEYLDDKLDQTQEEINQLNSTLSSISYTVSHTSADAREYMESMDFSYKDSMNSVNNELDRITDTVAQDNPETQVYVDNIKQAQKNIEDIQNAEGPMTAEQIAEIQRNMDVINSNLESIQNITGKNVESTSDATKNISEQLTASANSNQSIQGLVEIVDNGIQSVNRKVNKAVQQADNLVNGVYDDLGVVTGEDEYISDISSEENEDMDGVVAGCTNLGDIAGDLNVGGIIGSMNVEYDADPEFDLDFTVSLNVAVRSTVNDVVIGCINKGSVSTKKNNGGGIAGLQELGLIYNSENYGTVHAEAGSYQGGIAGNSASALRLCYALCNVIGQDYLGGIAGSGYTLEDCISICVVRQADEELCGEYHGSVAGYVNSEGTVTGNRYVSDELYGIDDISYAGIADKYSYEAIMELPGMPEGFRFVTVTFETEDEILDTLRISYGNKISAADYPDCAALNKDGYYMVWPEPETFGNVTSNITVTGEYIAWSESVAGDKVSEDGKPIVLLAGQFYRNTDMILQEASDFVPSDPKQILCYEYDWTLFNEREKEYNNLTAHLLIPDKKMVSRVYLKLDGVWTEVPVTQDGSYVTVEIPYGISFAMVSEHKSMRMYYIIGGAAAGAILLIVIIASASKHARRKKSAASADVVK